MKTYKKEQYKNELNDLYEFILTNDAGLALALGCIGYRVFLERKEGAYFPHYHIVATEKIDADINSYYQGSLMVNAYLLAGNIETLSNIVCSSSESLSIEIPIKSFH